MDLSFIERLRRVDQQRRSFPGEHWLALAAGLWFLKRKGGSLPARLSSKALGAALLYRAASGRDGIRKLWHDDARTGSSRRAIDNRSLSQDDFMPEDPARLERRAGSAYEPRGGAVGAFPDFR